MPDKLHTIVSDKQQIDQVTQLFFSIFSTTNQRQPNWSLIHTICIPEAMIIKKTDSATIVYNLESFIEPRKKILSDGTLTDFEESETKEETTILGNIAQRYSKYQKSGYLNGNYFKEYGNKLFQFVKTGPEWKISSLIWEDDK